MARWMPPSSRPGTARSRATVEPVASTTASHVASSSSAEMSAPTVTPVRKADALGLHERGPARDDVLVELHVRDAVHEQPADAPGPLEDGDQVAHPVELVRRGETRRTRPDDGDRPPAPRERRGGRDPALVPGPVGDLLLDGLDRHRVAVDAHRARALAGRRADAARELREVVGPVEADRGLAPLAAVDEVVPLGDQVVDRAARGHAADQQPRVAVRDAAVHAARALVRELALGQVRVRLAPVVDPLQRRPPGLGPARDLDEPGRPAHQEPPTRARSRAFSSKAAISASSGLSPWARIRACASSTRR